MRASRQKSWRRSFGRSRRGYLYRRGIVFLIAVGFNCRFQIARCGPRRIDVSLDKYGKKRLGAAAGGQGVQSYTACFAEVALSLSPPMSNHFSVARKQQKPPRRKNNTSTSAQPPIVLYHRPLEKAAVSEHAGASLPGAGAAGGVFASSSSTSDVGLRVCSLGMPAEFRVRCDDGGLSGVRRIGVAGFDEGAAAGDTGLGDEAIGRGWWTTRAGGAGSVTSEMAAALLPPALPAALVPPSLAALLAAPPFAAWLDDPPPPP